MKTDVGIEARRSAESLWTAAPCGSTGDVAEDRGYFLAVERERYTQQGWMHRYFDFAGFKGKSVLEIGIGQGTDLVQFAQAGARCYGVDITPRHLDLAQRNLDQRGLSAELKLCDATALDYPDQMFDCVYSFGVLHHVPEIGESIAEAHRVLKPGGVFYLTLYHAWSKDALSLLVGQGLLKGKLWRLGYSGLLATVERGADGVEFRPYVRLYSRRCVRQLLHRFQVADVSVHQLEVARLPRWLARWLASLEHHFGWYVSATALRRQ